MARIKQVAIGQDLAPVGPSASTRRFSPSTTTRSAMSRHDLQLVRGGDQGLATLREPTDQVDQDPLGARVERRGRLVQQQHLRPSERTDAIAARFFSPPESSNGARSARCAIFICRSASSQQLRTSSAIQPELERAEGDVVEDGRAEELHVGILEDQADLAMEAEGILAVGHRGNVLAQRAQSIPTSVRSARPAA